MKRRGSAMVFAMVMVVAMTASIMVTLTVTTNALISVRKQEEKLVAHYVLEGAAVLAVADQGRGIYTPPMNRNYIVNGASSWTNVSDNTANITRTLKLKGTVKIKGNTYSEERIVGQRLTPSPFYYALFVDGGFLLSHNLTTGSSGANGDVYVRGTVDLLSLFNTVNGELETSSSLVAVGDLSITGSVWYNTKTLTLPTVNPLDYSSASGVTTIGSSLNGATFTTGVTGAQLMYAPGNLSIRGTFRNKGTIFVNGDVTVTNSMSYFDSNSRLAVIATGNIYFNNPNVVGYWYGNNASVGLSGLNISRGGLAVKGFSSLLASLTIENDPAIWNDPAEGPKMYLPGFYP